MIISEKHKVSIASALDLFENGYKKLAELAPEYDEVNELVCNLEYILGEIEELLE